jgi:hypothetical protein
LRVIAREKADKGEKAEKAEKGELGRLERMRLKDAMERIVNSVTFVENTAELMGRLD